MMAFRILRDRRGATATEFALAAPVFIGMIVGVSQLGILFFANAGIQHAVEQAARTAAVYPTPSDAQIRASFDGSRFGMKGVLTPTIQDGTSDDGMTVKDISLSYQVPLDFIFFQTPPVTLTHSRRIFLQEEDSSSSSSSGGSTSTGGTTSASSTTSGGTTSASSTTSGGTTSSTSSTSSGNGNSSSGNGNSSSGNGNGSSGNCKKKC